LAGPPRSRLRSEGRLPTSWKASPLAATADMGSALNCTAGLPDILICDADNLDNIDVLGEFHRDYTLGQELGKGAQGKVHLCRVRETGKLRAVKIFDRSKAKASATFRRELEFLEAHRNPHIVQVLDQYLDTEYCYLVMERFTCHLRKGFKWICSLNGGPAALGNVALRNIVQQAFSAVLHLHRRQVVHRDVKAQNLLADKLDVRDPHLRVVLIDFGFAQYLEPGKVLTSRVGTRKYWPPEVFDGRYDHSMDIFALGVIGFLAASGLLPYADENASRTRDIFGEGAIPDHADEETRTFMERCLEKDPKRRASAAELANDQWLREPVSPRDFQDFDNAASDESSSSDFEGSSTGS